MKPDEIKLIDALKVLDRQKFWALGALVIAMACGVLFIVLIHSQWEATALIRIGQIGQPFAADRAVEPIASVIERIRFKSFQDAIMKAINVDPDSPESSLYRKSITVDAIANTDLVRLKVRALNTGQARQLAQVIFDRLRHIHQALSEAILAETRKQLEQSTQALQVVLAEQEELRKDVSSENLNDAALSPYKALIANVAMASKIPEILDLRKRKFDLEQALNSAHTYPTSLFDDISVPQKAVFPDKLLTLFLAFVAGGIFGCLVALFRDYAVRKQPG